MRRTSTAGERLRPRCSRPWVASRRLSWATTRCTCGQVLGRARGQRAVELAQRLAGGSDWVRSISARSSSRRTWRSNSRRPVARHGVRIGQLGPARSPCRPSVRRMRCTSTPITPEPSPWRPKAAIASRARSRISPSEPGADRVADALAQRVEVESLAALEALLLEPALHRLALHGAEEEAVEHELEHAAGPPATWRASRPAPRGSPRARSSSPRRARGRRRAARRCPPPCPRGAARRRTRAAAAPCRRGRSGPASRRRGRPA